MDGDRLEGLFWAPRRPLSPTVLLLPMQGRGKEEWAPLATRLGQQGYGVLAIDFRQEGRGSRDELLADARAAFAFLRLQKKVDAARIGLIGADLGANVAVQYAAAEPMARLAVLLSPGQNYRGVASEPALRDYGVRPLLLLAAEEDVSSAPAVRRLAEAARGEAEVKLYPGAAHGTELLAGHPASADEILAFLKAHL
ncbi:MAG: dienelactone hydrolase family protein [Acidobacteria bacterium]|nr:dienelactone hydrolase family protein [Acidobacteriota bacterium]